MLTAGVVCFGLLVGFITYRTLVRTTEKAAISDLATVIGAVGGGAVTAVVKPGTDLFGWYAVALLVGFVSYAGFYIALNGLSGFANVMGRGDTVAGSPAERRSVGRGGPRA